jgi:hypothetical protein
MVRSLASIARAGKLLEKRADPEGRKRREAHDETMFQNILERRAGG